MVGVITVRIRADVRVEQPYFTCLDEAIGIFQIGLSVTGRFDFGAGQYDTRLELFDNFVIMKSLAIDGDVLHELPLLRTRRTERIPEQVILVVLVVLRLNRRTERIRCTDVWCPERIGCPERSRRTDLLPRNRWNNGLPR